MSTIPSKNFITPSLASHGITRSGQVSWNLGTAALYEEALRRGEGLLAESGPLVCNTGIYTGRSPNDRFIVREPSSEGNVSWGSVNRSVTAEQFEAVRSAMFAALGDTDLFVQDCFAGADPNYRIAVRIITERAWHSLFARTMFLSGSPEVSESDQTPDFTVISMPSIRIDPAVYGTNSEVFILLNFAERLILVGGTSYAGEIKKSIFTVMNYLLPQRDVMPMHCSANVGEAEDVALFFGLSGTGKTTLSSDPCRRLIGDDEHGWSVDGVFNFEGGCYAKMIRLSPEAEPQIYAAVRRFGSVLENVVMDPNTRTLNFDDKSLTENTRGAYPISYIDDWVSSGQAGHPRNLVMLTADAFGVLPPISRLSPAAAMYHFLSGYTAKVAGTEKGLTEPVATFSACFGAPFMVWQPTVYAKLLGERIAKHDTRVWLVNTGWTGGSFGVGRRMEIHHTRAMITAALSGGLDDVKFKRDAVFNVDVPENCPNVPPDALVPRTTWTNKTAYDEQAGKLAGMFAENFKSFEAEADDAVKTAGPRLIR